MNPGVIVGTAFTIFDLAMWSLGVGTWCLVFGVATGLITLAILAIDVRR